MNEERERESRKDVLYTYRYFYEIIGSFFPSSSSSFISFNVDDGDDDDDGDQNHNDSVTNIKGGKK